MSARRAILFSLWAALALLPFRGTAAPAPTADLKSASAGPEVDLKFIDGSTLKVKLLDEKLELVTKHGTLQVAVADVRRVEFATRIPQADADKIRAAVQALGSPEHKVRQQASADIKTVGPRAFGALQKAAEHEDPEVARRAEELIAFLKAKFTEQQLEFREKDVIHTDDSKLAGTLSAATLRIGTFQFGELRAKLADVAGIGDMPDEDALLAANAAPAPANLMNYANQIGKVLTFRVTGGQVQGMQGMVMGGGPGMVGGGMVAGGTVWGTDQYTLDSTFPTAAVHAGVVQNGQTKTVRVKIVAPPNQFTGLNRNGVQSHAFGPFPSGAFEFVGGKKK